MATGGRKSQLQVVHEISAAYGPVHLNSGGGVLGVLPAGAALNTIRLFTTAAFDPTTATIALGTSPGGAQIAAAQNVKPVGRIDLTTTAAQAGPFAVDTPIYWTPAITGGPATIGNCIVWLEYLAGAG